MTEESLKIQSVHSLIRVKIMTVQALAEMLSAKIINNADFTRQVATGYAGDLLSFVMGKAPADSAWFTVMTNINICARFKSLFTTTLSGTQFVTILCA